MQDVKISKKTFDIMEKNTVLDYEQARWYTQKEGFIPIPRKSNKYSIKVVFVDSYFWGCVCVLKLKIKKYRISRIVDNDCIIGYIISFELTNSNSKLNHYFIDPEKLKIYTFSRENLFEGLEFLDDGIYNFITDFC